MDFVIANLEMETEECNNELTDMDLLQIPDLDTSGTRVLNNICSYCLENYMGYIMQSILDS